MPPITIVGTAILVYLAWCVLAGWLTFKMIRDYNRVYYFTVHQINHIMYYFCLLIIRHQTIIPKFDEFVPLVFAQKKKFFFHTKHTIFDYKNLYRSLKEDIIYTENYLDKSLHDRDQLIPVEDSIAFLTKVYSSMHFIWWMFAIVTFGLGSAVIFRPMK